MTSELLMDDAQTERFESACAAAGARFVGACSPASPWWSTNSPAP